MAYAELGTRINVPPERVWEVITGSEITQLMLSMYADDVKFDGEGEGKIITTTLKDGAGTIRERFEYLNNEEKCLKYRVIDSGPFPYACYLGEMNVLPAGPGACTLSLQCHYIPVDMEAEESNRFWIEHNKNFFVSLKKYLGVD